MKTHSRCQEPGKQDEAGARARPPVAGRGWRPLLLWAAVCSWAVQPAAAAERQAAIEALKEEATEAARQVAEDFPNTADAFALMGSVHTSHGCDAEALKCWQKSLRLDPRRTDVLDGMARAAQRRGELEEAVGLWGKALAIAPGTPGIRSRLARGLMALGRQEDAIAALEREIELSPREGLNYFLLGQQYLQARQYEKARKHYEAAIAAAPELTNAYYGLATVCARLGQTEKADQYRERFKELKAQERKGLKARKVAFDDLTEMRRTLACVHTDAGRVYCTHRRAGQAEKHWQRAAALDPRHTLCRSQLASLYQAAGREREALQVLEQLREIEPHNGVHCLNIGVIHARSRRFDAAEGAFRRTIELAPDRPWGHRELARLYLVTRRKLPEARKLAEAAVKLEPSADSYCVLSEACDRNGDRAAALAAMKRAIDLEPGNRRYRRIYELLQKGTGRDRPPREAGQ